MKVYLAVVSAGFLGASAFNAVVDPWSRLRAPAYGLESGWPEGKVLATPANFNEREFQARRAADARAPETLVLGNSHASQLDARMFPKGTFYNGWISSSYLTDALAEREEFRARGAKPRRLILVVEPKTFIAGGVQYDWLTRIGRIQEFAARTSPGARGLRLKLVVRRLRTAADELASLANWRRLTESAAALTGPRPRFYFVDEKELPADATARREDGSMIYPTARTRAKEPGPEELAADVAREAPGTYSPNWETRALLERLVDETAAEGGTTVLLVMPVRGSYHAALTASPAFAAQWADFRKDLAGFAAGRGGASVCDRLDPASARCADTEFHDGDHPDRACTEKVVRSCFP